ncbi:SpoIIE family protein phosphatase [Nocardioides daejeonensis]|uniref:SpoIIE family protein phosphatase n=1 Tax=Nocardioides daejeonensis TaxID=1046556 RepID=UPI000D74DAAB|nr:SpoIIE family protein phosphatase [Nocardioides daejeonensis]
MPTTPTDVQVPSRLPVVPGVVLHGSYLLTDREPINRGDTLDAVVLPDHRLALLVADVVGHGFAASMAATQVRTVLRERLLAGAGLLGAVAALDGYLRHMPDGCAVTLCAAVLDPVTGDLEFVAVGHHGPVVLSRDGGLWRARTTPTAPLGVGEPPRPEVGLVRLAADELLLLYTDGLPPGEVDPGVVAAQVVRHGSVAGRGDPASQLDSLCTQVLQEMMPPGGAADDAVLLAACRMPEPEALTTNLPARHSSVASARQALDHWLDEVGAGLLDHTGLVQAVDEVTTNVVDHAYGARSGDGGLELAARLDRTGQAVVTVTDHGLWPADAPLGFGLMMAAGLADGFLVNRGRDGTTVELRHELARPVGILQAIPEQARPVPLPDWDQELELETRPGRVIVRGAVDDLSVDIFHAALHEASEAGNRPLTVDLREVTRLASPGVQSLHEFRQRARAAGEELVVLADAASGVARVLAITAVPYVEA